MTISCCPRPPPRLHPAVFGRPSLSSHASRRLPSLGGLCRVELRTQPFSVTLTRDPARGGGGLGFSIAGGRGSLPRGGGATGEGDEINGADVTQCSHEEAVALLTATPGASVTMDLPPSNGSSAVYGDASDSPFPVEEITLALDDGSTGQPQQMGLSICVGDRILAVNGRDLRQAAHHEAVAALKENRYRLKLRVRHDPPPAGMRTLTIHRVDKTKKLGITITGGLTPGGGVFSEDGRIKPGMRLLEVNGRTLLGVSRQEAASILRDLPAEIRVVMICDGFPAEPAGKQQPQARPRQDPSRPRLESTTSIDRDEEVENLKGLQAQVVRSLDSDLMDAQHLL
uniref:PDZ domain-containing protein n=1 Tax=Macrostomum lignano TaxID=282301 RepID=A0A1I8F790_9PLAT